MFRLIQKLGRFQAYTTFWAASGQPVDMLCFLVVVMARALFCLLGMPFKSLRELGLP